MWDFMRVRRADKRDVVFTVIVTVAMDRFSLVVLLIDIRLDRLSLWIKSKSMSTIGCA